MMGYPTNCPGPWYVTSPPRPVSCNSMFSARSRLSSSKMLERSAPRPSVKTGGCSSSKSCSGARPAAQSSTARSCMVRPVEYSTRPSMAASQMRTAVLRAVVGGLNGVTHDRQVLIGDRPVDDPMVETQSKIADLPYRDRVVDHDGPLLYNANTEDRHLGLIDDRSPGQAAEYSRIRDRKRSSLHLVRLQLLAPRSLAQIVN